MKRLGQLRAPKAYALPHTYFIKCFKKIGHSSCPGLNKNGTDIYYTWGYKLVEEF